MGIFRGQGATEYLVLLAVVLIVALVSVALLGFFPGMASDAKITQSQSYWRGQAKPFAILDMSLTSTAATLSVQNVEATGPYVIAINGILIAGNGTNSTTQSFAAGEVKTIVLAGSWGACSTPGTIYDFNATIAYTAPNMPANTGKQFSAKNLVGKCM